MANRSKHFLLIYFHSISKVYACIKKNYNHGMQVLCYFILSATFHVNRTQQYCHQAFAEALNLRLVSSLLFYFPGGGCAVASYFL